LIEQSALGLNILSPRFGGGFLFGGGVAAGNQLLMDERLLAHSVEPLLELGDLFLAIHIAIARDLFTAHFPIRTKTIFLDVSQ
jgi:hypothetical protein